VTWTKLLASHDVQRHRTSKKELDDIRALIDRDLADAAVAGRQRIGGSLRRATRRCWPRTWRSPVPGTVSPQT
jgi:hypothetical protein